MIEHARWQVVWGRRARIGALALACALLPGLSARAQVTVVDQDGQVIAPPPPAQPLPPVFAPSARPATDNRGIYFRTTAELGYGRFEFLTAERWGGGFAFSTGITLGAGIGRRLMIGGSLVFKGILRANGESSDGRDWGPFFSPGGYVGPTLGVLGERVAFDLTLGVGGGGSAGAGGAGLIIAPALTVSLLASRPISVGLILKPDLWILYDTESERPLVYVGATAGLSFVFH